LGEISHVLQRFGFGNQASKKEAQNLVMLGLIPPDLL